MLAQHYGLMEEELDFIINYDIKYRMGRDAEGEEERRPRRPRARAPATRAIAAPNRGAAARRDSCPERRHNKWPL